MVEFASKLVESFEYQLRAVETVEPSELLEDCEMVDFRHAEKAIREGVVSLLVANFSKPTVGFHRGRPWKNALAEMDHDIVGLTRSAALNPISVGVLGDSRLYSDTLELLAANHGVLPEDFRVRQACNALHAVAVFDASVARLAGSGAATVYEHLAVAPSQKHLERYDVLLLVPGLAADPEIGCIIGQTGRAFFDRRPLDLFRG